MQLVESDGWVLRTIALAAEERLRVATRGLCASHPDPGLWHRDDKGEDDYSAEDTQAAIGICQSCPIRTWCEATFDAEPHGVFGGRTPRQRVERRSRNGRREANTERVRLWRQRRRELDAANLKTA